MRTVLAAPYLQAIFGWKEMQRVFSPCSTLEVEIMFQVCDPTKKSNAVVIEFEGCLDNGKCMEIESEVSDSLVKTNLPIVFDLAKVDFISSSFLRMCVYADQKAGVMGFSVTNADPLIKRVFQVAGLGAMLRD
jgi:anti-anti-sigma factor